MFKIFISYRREDAEPIAGRLYDRLEPHFGRDNLFMDIDTIPFGVDFREHLEQAVGQCDLLLAVIGEHWLDIRFKDGPKQGQRRLEDPTDFVRIEIGSALDRGVFVRGERLRPIRYARQRVGMVCGLVRELLDRRER